MMLRAAVIGLGHLGRHHSRLLQRVEGVEVTAVCDLQPHKLDQPECPAGAFRTANFREIFGRADVAVVAVPTEVHEAVAVPLLEAGLDVLVEKPLAADAPGARRMVEAARGGADARVLRVGHVERFNGAYRAMAGHLRGGVRFVEGHRLACPTARGLDVDVVLDLMIHDLDLLRLAVGRPALRVEAMGVPVTSSRVDIASARITFDGGCVANLTASRVSTRATRKLRFFDREAYWSLDLLERRAEVTRLGRDSAGEPAPVRETVAMEGDPLELELEDFILACRARRGGRAHAAAGATGEDGLAALELALEVRAAIDRHFAAFPQSGA